MSLYRKAIRHAAVALLLGATSAQGRVYDNRSIALGKGQEFPCILVVTDEERTEIQSEGPRKYLRELTLVVSFVVEHQLSGEESANSVDGILADKLDELAYEIERAITGDEYLGDTLSKPIELNRFEPSFDAEGEMPRAQARLYWTASYLEELPDPNESALVPFQRAHVEVEADAGGSVAEGIDELELPQ